jgi:GTP-binding protein LepA
LRALVFDFKYSDHKGVIVYVRVLDGEVRKGENLLFKVANEKFISLEVGTFSPEEFAREKLSAGDIGYIVTGIKKPGIASVGDTITLLKNPLPAFPGYLNPQPVVWASVYPESQDDFNQLRMALGRLKLSDSAFSFEEESSGALGRGYRCGFLGMLHLEIITERLKREFDLNLVVTTPSITYYVTLKNGKRETIYSPHLFPNDGEIIDIEEPWVNIVLITPMTYLGNVMQMLFDHEAEVGKTENFGDDRSEIEIHMPLREMMRNFFDELKSATCVGPSDQSGGRSS